MERYTMDNGVIREMTQEEIEEQDTRLSISPPRFIPQQVSAGQAREALYNAGLLPSIAPAIDAIADEDQRWRARNAWEYRPTVERYSPFVRLLAEALGLSEDQLDELFIDAASL